MDAVRDKIARSPTVDYDPASDVLYVTAGAPVADEGEDRPGGIVLRYAWQGDAPSGVTVFGFVANGWPQKLDSLAIIIGEHLKNGSGRCTAGT